MQRTHLFAVVLHTYTVMMITLMPPEAPQNEWLMKLDDVISINIHFHTKILWSKLIIGHTVHYIMPHATQGNRRLFVST